MSHVDFVKSEGHFLKINGWAFIKNTNSEDATTYVVFKSNKKTLIAETMPVYRPDVAEVYKPLNVNNSGFLTIILNNHFDLRDEYRIGIYIRKGNKEALSYTDKVLHGNPVASPFR